MYIDVLLENAGKWLLPSDDNLSNDNNTVSVHDVGSNSNIVRESFSTDGTSMNGEMNNTVSESESLLNQELTAIDGVDSQNELDKPIGEDSRASFEHKTSTLVDDNDVDIAADDSKTFERNSNANLLNTDDSDVVVETCSETADDEDQHEREIDCAADVEPIRKVAESEEKGPYHNVRVMMQTLKLEDQVFRFENNFIRDPVLIAEREILKGILKEADFPAGLVYEICLYLDQEEAVLKRKVTSTPLKLDEKENKESVRPSPGAFPEKNGSSQYGTVSRFGAQYQEEAAPRRKLLGIGRGINFDAGKNRPGLQSQYKPPNRGREVPSNNRPWVKQGNWSDNDRKRNMGTNWRPRNDRKDNEGRYMDNRSGSGSNSWSSPGSRSRESEDETARRNNGMYLLCMYIYIF